MVRPDAADPPRNRLLSGLPAFDRERLLARARLADLPGGAVLADLPGASPGDVVFAESGLIGLHLAGPDGTRIGLGSVSDDMAVGLAQSLSGLPFATTAVVECPGRAWIVDATTLRAAHADSPAVRDMVLRCAAVYATLIAENMLCNATHTVPQRMARWIATYRRRTGGDTCRVMQEYLSAYFSVKRTTVTQAGLSLSRANLIAYSRGSLTVLDPDGLDRASCGCDRRLAEKVNRIFACASGVLAPGPA
ncbi:Crp/Fnr family transcriptional regulator [Chthonobacter rhizosphaerae]|uniref:Crp/Fnr family transcriptional regulator n=1 Tax=Chthonobacter rhizosphaerae TaxID=2735553 RepID=UPI0015EEA8BA|nr:Crp/Fnr family transcriptional regulator [Chthonobacter rhizosphaerae]